MLPLQDIIFALAGHPGDLITLCDKRGEGQLESNLNLPTLSVADNISFIEDSEKSIINHMCILGSHYLYLKSFCYHYLENKSSLYIIALATAIQEILDQYSLHLVEIEREIRAQDIFALSAMEAELRTWRLVLPEISSLIFDVDTLVKFSRQNISTSTMTSAQTLPIILTHTWSLAVASSFPLSDYMLKILKHLHEVLFKQLSSWLLHGTIIDPYREFVISDISSLDSDKENTISNNGSNSNALTENSRFRLRKDLIPKYLPSDAFENLHFIGLLLIQLKKSWDLFDDEAKTDIDDGIIRLAVIEKEPITSVLLFEEQVSDLRFKVMKLLGNVLRNNQTLQQIYSVYDVVFLSNGELWEVAFQAIPTRKSLTTQNWSNAFAEAAVELQFKKKFHVNLSWNFSTIASNPSSLYANWRSLSPEFSFNWPMNLLFSGNLLAESSRIFSLLFIVKKINLLFQYNWKILKCQPVKKSHIMFLVTRHRMAFFVQRLLDYFLIDIVESERKRQYQCMKDINDLDSLLYTNNQLINNISVQFFLKSKIIGALNWKPSTPWNYLYVNFLH